MKVTPVKCTDGKRHRWRYLAEHISPGTITEIRWCKECGSVTEFYVERFRGIETITKRCLEPDGSYYIMIPELVKIVT